MPDSVVLSVEPPRIRVSPGEKAPATVIVRNRTEEMGQYTLQVEGEEAKWATLDPAQVSVFPLQSARVQLLIQPPPDATGATYRLEVRATSQHPGVEGKALLDVEVHAQVQARPAFTFASPPQGPGAPAATTAAAPAAAPGASAPGQPFAPPAAHPAAQSFVPPHGAESRLASAAQIEVEAEPVQDGDGIPHAHKWQLMLHNAGTVLDTFGFSLRGLDPGWVKLDSTQVALGPGERAKALLTITPSDDTYAGEYPFVLRTYSHVNVNQRTDLPVKLQVHPFRNFTLQLPEGEAETQGEYEAPVALVSDPKCNADIQVTLTASDEGGACEYSFDHSTILVPARLTVASRLRVSPKTLLGPGERREFTIKVTATPHLEAAAAQSGEFRLAQTGATPVNLSLRPQQQTAEVESDYLLSIVNPVATEAVLVFSGVDPESACDFIFDPPELVLPPHGQAETHVRVAAKNYFEGDGQKMITFNVLVTRRGDKVPAAKIQGSLVQKQLRGISLELTPPQVSSPGTAHYYLQGYNPRANAIKVQLGAKDEADSLLFYFTPSELYFLPRAEGRATLVVHPKDRLIPGEQRRVHPFAVLAEVENQSNPITLAGVLAQTPSLTLWDYIGYFINWLLWILQWVIAAVIIIFLLTVAVDAVVTVTDPVTNPIVFTQLNKTINRGTLLVLLDYSPFKFLADLTVKAIFQLMNAFGGGGLPTTPDNLNLPNIPPNLQPNLNLPPNLQPNLSLPPVGH